MPGKSQWLQRVCQCSALQAFTPDTALHNEMLSKITRPKKMKGEQIDAEDTPHPPAHSPHSCWQIANLDLPVPIQRSAHYRHKTKIKESLELPSKI
jgi:hypothetical protein